MSPWGQKKNVAAASGLWTFVLSILGGQAALADNATANNATPVLQGNVLEEVVVSAVRKRAENVQTTPIAITALSSATLERSHVTSFSAIGSLAPNLQMFKTLSSADAVSVYLRGFGAEADQPAVDPHVAIFVDGIYQPAMSGANIDMFDISQVAVAAGPQGTLAGKNAAVGAVYITSDKPTGDFSGAVEGDYGSYDHVGLRAKLNFPIFQDATGDTVLAGKVSLVEKEGGNWVYNLANGKRDMGGENEKAGRVAFSFTPSPAFEWDLTSSLLLNRNPQQGLRAVNSYGGVAGNQSTVTQPFPRICTVYGAAPCAATPYGTTDSSYTTIGRTDSVQVASTMTYHMDAVTLTSVTGYLSYWLDKNSDVSGTTYNVLDTYDGRQRYDQESEEFRISSNKNAGLDLDGRLDWVVGGYFSNHAYSVAQNLGVFAAPFTANSRSYQNGDDQSTAVFGHFIYNFTDQWSGIFGVRQSWDQKNHNYQPSNVSAFSYDIPIGFHNTSFEVGTQYQFDADRMAYVRFAQGYASGGYLGFPSVAGAGASFQPETNNSYEVGIKSDWLDKRLRVNFDFFLNEISDLQLSGTRTINTAPFLIVTTTNAGAATVEGFESQIVALPTDDLTTHLNVGFLHPRYDRYVGTTCSNVANVVTDCSGLPFGLAPKWTINLGADYVMDLPSDLGTAVLSADWDYKSSLYADDPPYPSSRQEGYGLVNASLKFLDQSEKHSIEFYGTNILNRRYKVGVSDAGGVIEAEDGRPAEWGLRLTWKFGPL